MEEEEISGCDTHNTFTVGLSLHMRFVDYEKNKAVQNSEFKLIISGAHASIQVLILLYKENNKKKSVDKQCGGINENTTASDV